MASSSVDLRRVLQSSLRGAYARTAHAVGTALERTRVDAWLAARKSPLARHVRSLGAIWDLGRMIALDVPWWTYPAISEVEAFLAARDGKARVFEYGAGASTVWLARRCRAGEVHSVEHDAGFVAVLQPELAGFDRANLIWVAPTPRTDRSTAVSERAGYRHRDFGAYVDAIEDVGGQFDLVVIDGRARPSCLERAIPHLADDGLVVFDNAARARYRPAIESSGLAVDVRRGWAPALPYREATALLRKAR